MIVIVRVEVSDEDRARHARFFGRKGKATREEIRTTVEGLFEAWWQDVQDEDGYEAGA